jgi:hypothetical protein
VYSQVVNLAPDDDPVQASWADVCVCRSALPWQEELEKRALRDQIVTLVGPWRQREAALWLLAEKLQTGRRVQLMAPKTARSWTYGRGAAETLGKVFMSYQATRAHDPRLFGVGSQLAPLVWDTLEGWARTRAPGAADPAAWAVERWQTTDNERDHVVICHETQEWLVGNIPKPTTADELLPVAYVARPFQFLLMSHRLGLIGPVHLAFDGLDFGSEYKLKSIEKLLSLAQECVTPLSFVLGWSGSDDDFKRLASELPVLATELKRSAFYLP